MSVTIFPIETRWGPRNGLTIINANDLIHQIQRSYPITILFKRPSASSSVRSRRRLPRGLKARRWAETLKSKDQPDVEENERHEGQLFEECPKVTVTFAEQRKTILTEELNQTPIEETRRERIK